MILSQNLLDELNIRRLEICAEVNSFKEGYSAYLLIIPISENRERKYKSNLSQVISYEVRYIRHKDEYTLSEWGDDYDYVLADITTRIKRYFIEKSENNLELQECINQYSMKDNGFNRLVPYEKYNSTLIHNDINSYIENELELTHLFEMDYMIK